MALIDCVLHTKLRTYHTKMSDTLWPSQGAGVVKQESYSKNGKLESRMELAAFSK